MKNNNMKVKWGNVKRNLSKNSPLIMTGIGIAASIGAVVTAFKVAPKAKEVLNQVEAIRKPEDSDGKIFWEKTKAVAPIIAPVVIQEAVAIGCIAGSYKVNSRRLVALSTAYSLSERRFDEYQKQVIKNLGERKEQKIRDEVAAEKIKNDKKSSEVQVEEMKVLCYDTITGRYFSSTRDDIQKAVNEINKRIIHEMFVSLNDFYYEIDIPQVEIGEALGWNSDDLLDVEFSSQLTDDGRPCLVMDYRIQPRFDYRKLY